MIKNLRKTESLCCGSPFWYSTWEEIMGWERKSEGERQNVKSTVGDTEANREKKTQAVEEGTEVKGSCKRKNSKQRESKWDGDCETKGAGERYGREGMGETYSINFCHLLMEMS